MQIDDENFEDDLSAENEFLRLKLLAEHGSETHSTGKLDPQIENAFLKHIVDFENIYKNSKRIKVFDLLGKPDFKPAHELNDDALNSSLLELISLLAELILIVLNIVLLLKSYSKKKRMISGCRA